MWQLWGSKHWPPLTYFQGSQDPPPMIRFKLAPLTYASPHLGNGTYTWYSASSWNITSEALRYGTCSQGISQFYLLIHMVIRNRNEPYLPLVGRYSFTDPGGMEGWVGLCGWLSCEIVYVSEGSHRLRDDIYCIEWDVTVYDTIAVTRPTINRAQCRATALIETNASPLH